jgi:hypothetical protein
LESNSCKKIRLPWEAQFDSLTVHTEVFIMAAIVNLRWPAVLGQLN